MRPSWIPVRLLSAALALWLAPPAAVQAQAGETSSLVQKTELEMLSPQDSAYWFQKDGRSSVAFTWRELSPARGRKLLTVARDCSFAKASILLESSLRQSPYRWNTKVIGSVCWRVSVLDPRGSVLYQSEARRLKIIPDQLKLADPSYVHGRYRFSWEQKTKPLFFRFKLSKEAAFDAPLINIDQKSKTYSLDQLPEGTYYWKVGVKVSHDLPIVYSPVQTLLINRNESVGLVIDKNPDAASLASAPESSPPLYQAAAKRPPPVPVSKPASLRDIETTVAARAQLSVPRPENGQTLYARLLPPSAALDAPRPLQPVDHETITLAAGESLRFTWRLAERSRSSEIQLSRDPSFTSVVSAVNYGDDYRFVPEAGSYFWRLRSFSDQGAVSPWSEPRAFTVTQPQEQIHLTRPEPGESWQGFKVAFAWDESENCQRYQLRWAMDEAFSRAVGTVEISGDHHEAELGDEGTYFWTVSCVQPNRALKSPVQRFEVKDE